MKGRKKQVTFSLIMIMACLICAVVSTYSWLSYSEYSGGTMNFQKTFVITGNRLQISSYRGTLTGQTASSITYSPIGSGGYSVNNAVPGFKQFFKTTVTNLGDTTAYFSLFITNLDYDEELADYVTLFVTSPLGITTYLNGNNSTTYTDEDNHEYRRLSNVPLAENYRISPSSRVDIYWYIDFSKEMTNECMEKSLHIDVLQVIE